MTPVVRLFSAPSKLAGSKGLSLWATGLFSVLGHAALLAASLAWPGFNPPEELDLTPITVSLVPGGPTQSLDPSRSGSAVQQKQITKPSLTLQERSQPAHPSSLLAKQVPLREPQQIDPAKDAQQLPQFPIQRVQPITKPSRLMAALKPAQPINRKAVENKRRALTVPKQQPVQNIIIPKLKPKHLRHPEPSVTKTAAAAQRIEILKRTIVQKPRTNAKIPNSQSDTARLASPGTDGTSATSNSTLPNSTKSPARQRGLNGNSTGTQMLRVAAIPLANNEKPRYPRAARRRGQTGRVLLDVVINKMGQVETITVATSSGFDSLDHAAKQAVAKWRFRPAQINGRSIRQSLKIPITFRLTE